MHLATAHLHGPRVRGRDELLRLLGINADQHPTLSAGGDGHIAADEECEPAEHLPFGKPTFIIEQFAYAFREFFVVRHGAIVRRHPAVFAILNVVDSGSVGRWFESNQPHQIRCSYPSIFISSSMGTCLFVRSHSGQ